jgi:hypothetical protein
MKCSNVAASILAIAALAACAGEPSTTAPDLVALDAKAGSQRLYKVTIEGDFTLPASGGDVLVSRSATDPFANSDIGIDNVTFTIGAGGVMGPSGDDAICAAAYPNAFTNTNQGSWPDDWNGNEGDWSGTVTISEKRHIVNVRGSRAGQTVQSSQSTPGMTKSKHPDGSWSLTFDDALQYFGGGGSTTSYDAKYRCVDFRVVLTPV